jgi:hypothetical protein
MQAMSLDVNHSMRALFMQIAFVFAVLGCLVVLQPVHHI